MHLLQLFLRRPHVVQPRLHVRRLRSPRCVPSRYVAARVLHPRRRGMHRSVRDYALLQPLRVPFERPRLCSAWSMRACARASSNSTFPDSLVRFELVDRRTPPRASRSTSCFFACFSSSLACSLASAASARAMASCARASAATL